MSLPCRSSIRPGARGAIEHVGSAHDVVELEEARRSACPATVCRKIREYGHRRPGGYLTRLRFGHVRRDRW
jgi:hypothetical protein